jgi:hypothetical protein
MNDVEAGVDAIGQAAGGNMIGAIGKAKKFFTSIGTPEPVRDQLGKLLLQGGPGAGEEFSRLLPITQLLNQDASTKAKALGGILATQQANLPWFRPHN